ncbi:MAG: large conductance mechanosensitive channel protein MscL [Actinomycetes bacterium]
MKGFKEFLMRGNVLDLAVAVVIGAAFTLVITSVVAGVINPLIAAVFGKPDLSSVGNFTINNADFSIGIVLTAVVNFMLVAAAVYFVLVLPAVKLRERAAKDEAAAGPSEVELLTEIRDSLKSRDA